MKDWVHATIALVAVSGLAIAMHRGEWEDDDAWRHEPLPGTQSCTTVPEVAWPWFQIDMLAFFDHEMTRSAAIATDDQQPAEERERAWQRLGSMRYEHESWAARVTRPTCGGCCYWSRCRAPQLPPHRVVSR